MLGSANMLGRRADVAMAVWSASSTSSALRSTSVSTSSSLPRGLLVVDAAGRGHHGRVARLLPRTITAADLLRVVVVVVVALESWSLLPQQGEGTTAVWPASSLAPPLRPACSASSSSSSSPSGAGHCCLSQEGAPAVWPASSIPSCCSWQGPRRRRAPPSIVVRSRAPLPRGGA